MRLCLNFVFATALLFGQAFASDPGQPLDCSDWEFLEPGLNCSVFIPDAVCRLPAPEPGSVSIWNPMCFFGHGTAVDAEGHIYRVRMDRDTDIFCNGGNRDLDRVEIRRFDGEQETVVAYIQGRCNPNNTIDTFMVSDNPASRIHDFDATNGRLFLAGVETLCRPINEGGSCADVLGSQPYPSQVWVMAVTGFATAFEILQTYTPTSGPISFRVPYMPEGFQAADWFDTYYGDIASVGDWGQAQPLECAYPTALPGVGDYLTVSDTLPPPDPGQGRYYVTAVNYQGQTRYGRKSIRGVLSGRDPAVLPTCIP